MKTLFKWIAIMVLAAVVLTGCGQAAPAEQEAAVDEAAPAEVEAESPSGDDAAAEDRADEETVAEEVDEAASDEDEDIAAATGEQEQAPEVQAQSQLEMMGETCMVSTFEDLLPIPPVTEDDWIQGPFDAPTTILVYSDLQCPYCSMMDPQLELLQQAHPDDIRLVWRHFPLSYHEHSLAGSMAIEAAGRQGTDAFFELKSRIFASQSEWAELTEEEFNTWVEEQATDMGLDVDQFTQDLQDEALNEKIQKSYIAGQTIVTGTPFVLINGIPAAAYGPDLESAFLNAKGLKERQYTQCPEMTIDTEKDYKAIVKTDQGDITIDLYEDEAPITVNSFVFLAQNGWFDNVPFHRVIPDFVAQAGDPLGLGFGGPGYIFVNEIDEDMKYDKEGVVGMANSGADTNGSQFFITYAPLEQLDGSYTIFGQVIEGMDVSRNLTSRDPSTQEELPEPSIISSVEIIEE